MKYGHSNKLLTGKDSIKTNDLVSKLREYNQLQDKINGLQNKLTEKVNIQVEDEEGVNPLEEIQIEDMKSLESDRET